MHAKRIVPSEGRKPRVVIIGAGFGGLTAAQALAKVPVDITLVDRRNFHLFQPLLYQVATAALSPGDIAWPIRSIFAKQRNVRTLIYEATGIDPVQQVVSDGSLDLPYDHLIVATGATHAYFGHERWAEFAPGLKTIEDARHLREQILLACESAERTTCPNLRRRYLTTVIVGGGATGVEMAGAVAELCRRTLKGEFTSIDPREMRIVLLEAGERLLAAFPERLSERCKQSLSSMGVEVRVRTTVTDCGPDWVRVDWETIEAATLVWAAGVKASPTAQWLGAQHDRANRVIVNPDLSVPGFPNIFVIGDTSAVRSGGRPVPGVSPAAKQMGRYVADLIAARVSGADAPSPFRYVHQGDLAVVGRKSAVVALGRVQMTGFIGWLFWSLVHVLFLVGFRSKVVVAFEWFWGFVTRQRGARLISDSRSPSAAAGTRSARLSQKLES